MYYHYYSLSYYKNRHQFRNNKVMNIKQFKKFRSSHSIGRDFMTLSLIFIGIIALAITANSLGGDNPSSSQESVKNPLQISTFNPEIIDQWRVRVIYNNHTNTLSLKDISHVQAGLPDYRSAKFSPFSFKLFDASG